MSKKPPVYRVQLEKEQLVFSAAHFITFNGNICERLHGHNYRVKCEILGPLDENGYVVDFIALRDKLLELIDGLDHRMLLPTKHPTINVTVKNDEVTATFESKRWVFPAEGMHFVADCQHDCGIVGKVYCRTIAQLLFGNGRDNRSDFGLG